MKISKLAIPGILIFTISNFMPLSQNYPAIQSANAAKSSLWNQGYALLPAPRKVEPGEGSIKFGADWEVELLSGLTEQHIAIRTLLRRLNKQFGINLSLRKGGNGSSADLIQLEIHPGCTAQGQKEALARQAYFLELKPHRILISGNDDSGLFYGVQTFLQLLGSKKELELPVCRIEDWPDLELRTIHWCEKEHQSRLNTLKEYLDRAAEYKINAVGWHLENTFAYQRHPVIGISTAFTREDIRELEHYANERFIELIPILDFPSHMSFLLKHPEFAHLRENPHSPYSICPSKEESWELLFDMLDELLEAFHGRYFHFSTDELFNLGDSEECGCAEKVKQIGKSGMFVEIVMRASKYLEGHGKQVMFWGERPLKPEDIPKLPNTLIDAAAGAPTLDRPDELKIEREHGMRVLIYFSTKGGEKRIFPDYFPYRYHQVYSRDHLKTMYQRISFGEIRENDVLGTFIAAWDDHGHNHEVIWLGLIAGSAYGWNAGTPEPDEIMPRFARLFYGPEALQMEEIYRLMNECALFWTFSWEKRRFLDLPPLPDPNTLAAPGSTPYQKGRYSDISYVKDSHLTGTEGHGFFDSLVKEKQLNQRLLALLNENLNRVSRNKYNLEVMRSMATCWLHNTNLLQTLEQIEDNLSTAGDMQKNHRYAEAISSLLRAEKLAEDICKERERVYQQYVKVWEVNRFPEGEWIIIQRERNLNLEKWLYDLKGIRHTFALKHRFDIPERSLYPDSY